MKRTLGFLFAFIIFVASAMLLTGCGTKTAVETQPVETPAPAVTTPAVEENHISKPWIQVTKAGVFIVANDNSTTTLASGDELSEGTTVATDASGLANVIFPDGSVARLDSNTKVTILTGTYDEETKTLSARFKLAAGNLWSKIIALATPESYWEVQTSNAVAAVRGTAFGVSYDKQTTTIIGSENTVAVKAINPETNILVAEQEASVGEGKYIMITNADIEPLTKKSVKLAEWVRATPKKILDAVWIKRALEADLKITTQLKSAESMGLTTDQSLKLYTDGLKDEQEEAQATAASDNAATVTSTVAATTTAAVNETSVDASGATTSDSNDSDTSATTNAAGATSATNATAATTTATLRSTLSTTNLRSVLIATSTGTSVTAAR